LLRISAGHPDGRIAASNACKPSTRSIAMSRTRKFAIAAAATILLTAVVITLGVVYSPFDAFMFLDDDMHHGGLLGGLLASVIIGVVLALVGLILTAVFTGVSLVLLVVGVFVGVLLLALALPVLLPLLAVIAVPFLALYGLFRLVTKNQQGTQPAA
jgi:hypothetical protein